MTAGTAPPAAEQVPPDNAPTPSSDQEARAERQTLAAASKEDRPARKSGPPGLEQVPANAQSQAQQPIAGTGTGPNAALGSAVDPSAATQPAEPQASSTQQSEEATQQSTIASKIQQPPASGWQRFKWLLWGTPPEFWKRGQPPVAKPGSPASTSSSKSTAASDAAPDGDGDDVKRSRFSLAGVIQRAILRTRVVRDEDVAR